MKTILISIMLVIVASTFKGFSQLKVYHDNRVKVFGDRTTDDPNLDLSLQVYGKYGSFLANAKIAFGEYANGYFPFDVHKVYFGEAGRNFDSDRLELCGSKGVYFTWGRGYEFNNVIAKMDQEYTMHNDRWIDISSFKFNVDLYTQGLKVNSDKRFKKQIKPVKNAATRLSKVKPVIFNLKPEEAMNLSVEFTPETEKEVRDQQEFLIALQKLKHLEKDRYGFVAQELQDVFPELVEQKEDGLYVDYLGLIPLLVETIKEQQEQLAGLQEILIHKDYNHKYTKK